MCVWHSGDMPRSTKVVASGAEQKRHEKLRALPFEVALSGLEDEPAVSMISLVADADLAVSGVFRARVNAERPVSALLRAGMHLPGRLDPGPRQTPAGQDCNLIP